MKSRTMAVAAALLLACLLTACGKKDTAPAVYTVGTDEVVSLDSIMGEGEALLSSVDAPTEEAVAAGIETYTYHYRQMADPAELAGRYVALLLSEEQGFAAIDGENHRLEETPTTDTLFGSIALGKKAAENEEAGKRFLRVLVGWSEYAVAVQVTYIEGSILPPVKKESEDANGSGSGSSTPAATGIKEQTEYFNSLDPRKLGLEGESMSEYLTFPQQGWVKVDEVDCREIMVYQMNPQTATNEIIGTFYLSSDLTKIYKKTSDGQITPVQMN